jgi:hypothetical protein
MSIPNLFIARYRNRNHNRNRPQALHLSQLLNPSDKYRPVGLRHICGFAEAYQKNRGSGYIAIPRQGLYKQRYRNGSWNPYGVIGYVHPVTTGRAAGASQPVALK